MGSGLCVPCARRDLSKAALPRLVLRQRENSSQYLASSWAASLRANTRSGDKSVGESDGMMTTSMGNGIIPSRTRSSVKQRKTREQEMKGDLCHEDDESVECIAETRAHVVGLSSACRQSSPRDQAGGYAARPENPLPGARWRTRLRCRCFRPRSRPAYSGQTTRPTWALSCPARG